MTLDDIRRIIALILGGRAEEVRELTPDNFSALLHYASLRYFHKKTGIPDEYQPGSPVSREMVEMVRENSMTMRQFVKVKGDYENAPIHTNDYGYADLPEDFYFPLSLYYQRQKSTGYVTTPIEIYSNDDFIRKLDDPLEKATTQYPMCTFQSKLRVAPKTIQRISMVYLKLPDIPVFAVKYENGMNVYDADNSVELEWDDMAIYSIISFFLESLSVKIGAADVSQYVMTLNQQGK